MAFCVWRNSAALVFLGAVTALSQQAPLIQPGKPGQQSKAVTVASAGTPYRGPTEADTAFMQGMIMHHSQAVEMVELLRTRGASKELRALGSRISISQTDEIKY